jgi:phage baseplate assembly protein V
MRPPRGYHPQFALAELLEVDDEGKQQTVTHHGLAGEKHSEVYRPQPFGFSSHPPKGSTGVVASLGGERNRSVFFGGEHDDHRPTKLKEGQVKNYDKAGNSIGLLADDGVATAVAKGDHATTVEKGAFSVTVKEKDVTVETKKGKVKITAKGDVFVASEGKVYLGSSDGNDCARVALEGGVYSSNVYAKK